MPSDPGHLDDPPPSRKRVLVAPLNWGLGHVSRCIPLIRSLEGMGVEVLVASDGLALHLLKAEFPHLQAVSLPSYGIRYFSQNMVMNIARQMPRILYAIRTEQWHTERIVRQHGVQGIISDNRYGCFSKRAKSILLTHQVNLKVPFQLFKWVVNKVLRLALAKFQETWVPDAATEPTLSGELSHPATGIPKPRYIGLLSRSGNAPQQIEQEYDVAVVLSGPEPQRGYLEQILLEQAISLPHKFIFILGKTKALEHHYAADNVEVVSYLTSRDLNTVLAASGVIVCRAGYSSLMDLAAIGKKAILIPTPGQTEQEYLARDLSAKNIFTIQRQDRIDLKAALDRVRNTKGLSGMDFPINEYEPALKEWISTL